MLFCKHLFDISFAEASERNRQLRNSNESPWKEAQNSQTCVNCNTWNGPILCGFPTGTRVTAGQGSGQYPVQNCNSSQLLQIDQLRIYTGQHPFIIRWVPHRMAREGLQFTQDRLKAGSCGVPIAPQKNGNCAPQTCHPSHKAPTQPPGPAANRRMRNK